MRNDRLSRVVQEAIGEIVEYRDGPDPLRITSGTTRLGHAVTDALAALDDHEPEVPTETLWRRAVPAIHRELETRHDRDLHDLVHVTRPGREYIMRQLPKRLRRALLAAYDERLRRHIRSRTRDTFSEYLLDYWISDHSVHLALYRTDESETWRPYPAAYRSPREKELEAVWNDSARPQNERLGALDELTKIEAKRLRDWEAKESALLRTDDEGNSEELPIMWLAAAQAGRMWRRECRKHGILGCSECGKRKKKRDSRAAKRRFEELAALAEWDPALLAAPAKRGRPTAEEQSRLRRLGESLKTLQNEGFTLEAMGEAIGGRRQRVHDLIRRAA